MASTQFRRTCSAGLLVAIGLTAASRGAVAEELPLFDLNELEVIHSETDFEPVYTRETPRFTYYEPPELPRGELILALEFMDRYRESSVPGSAKWAGILHFPVVDSYERPRLKWLCLYFYDDRMFGYDPASRYESERRFAVPIRYEDRLKPGVLLAFAESYVMTVFPGGEDEFVMDEDLETGDLGGGAGFSDIPPGRISGVFPSDRGLPAKELVKLIYQYAGTAEADAAAALGPAEDFHSGRFSWKAFWEKAGPLPDYLEIARQLVEPRWGQKVIFHYIRDRFLLADKPARQNVLLFNVGLRVFAYHPDYGVWRTEATVHDLSDGNTLPAKLRFPGIPRIQRVEFVPVAATGF